MDFIGRTGIGQRLEFLVNYLYYIEIFLKECFSQKDDSAGFAQEKSFGMKIVFKKRYILFI